MAGSGGYVCVFTVAIRQAEKIDSLVNKSVRSGARDLFIGYNVYVVEEEDQPLTTTVFLLTIGETRYVHHEA